MSMTEHLVTDRVRSDVAARNQKGTYNAADLNRVEAAVAALSGVARSIPRELAEYALARNVEWESRFAVPYDPSGFSPSVKLDWAPGDVPLGPDMARYWNNVAALGALADAAGLLRPALPASMERLTWEGANAIERTLQLAEEALTVIGTERLARIDRAAASPPVYAGEIYSGET